MSAGVARLAGVRQMIGDAVRRYQDSPLASAVVQGGLDFGLNLAQGVDPLTAATSAIGTGAGSAGGRLVGQKFGGDTGGWIGEFVGGYAGGFGGSALPMLMADTTQTGEPMRSPDSAQQDPRMAQMQQMQAQQAMIQQGLTPDQLRKMQERAARRAAEAQTQAQALQQYGNGQGYGGMY